MAAYRCPVSVTEPTARLLQALADNRPQIDLAFAEYGATNPRIFGSVARGDAVEGSDIDILVDLDPAHGNRVLRLAGLSERLSAILLTRVDVVDVALLRDRVSVTAQRDAVPL